MHTLAERNKRLLNLIKLPEFKSASAANEMQAFSDKLFGTTASMHQSMTYDQGQEQLDPIADQINNRPRKGLGARSPLAIYRELLFNSPLEAVKVETLCQRRFDHCEIR